MQTTKAESGFGVLAQLPTKALPMLGAGLLTIPIDRLQTIYQIQDTYSNRTGLLTMRQLSACIACAQSEIRDKQGFFACFRGANAFLYRSALWITIVEALSTPIKSVFDYEFGKDNKSIHRMILYSGSAVANILTYPLELVKQRMMTSRHEKYDAPLYRTPKACFKEVYSFRGVKGLYQGMSVSLLQNIAGLAVTDAIFDNLSSSEIIPQVYVRTMLSCSIAELLFYPLDTIKYDMVDCRKKLQMNGAINHKNTYRSIREATTRTLQSQGFKGLYRGVLLRLTCYMPLHSLVYMKLSSDMLSHPIY